VTKSHAEVVADAFIRLHKSLCANVHDPVATGSINIYTVPLNPAIVGAHPNTELMQLICAEVHLRCEILPVQVGGQPAEDQAELEELALV